MPKYDAENFDPPAPVAYVSVRDPETGTSLPNMPMLIYPDFNTSVNAIYKYL